MRPPWAQHGMAGRIMIGRIRLRWTLFRRLVQGCQTLLVKELFVARMKTQNVSPRTEYEDRACAARLTKRVQHLCAGARVVPGACWLKLSDRGPPAPPFRCCRPVAECLFYARISDKSWWRPNRCGPAIPAGYEC